MRVTADQSARGSTATDTDRLAMYAVATKLHDFGFGIRLPKDRQSRHLVILNARHACSEITVSDSGSVIWDYWPWSGAATDPADLAEVALSLLGPADTHARPVVSDGPTLKSRVGLALRGLGLNVTMVVYEDHDALDLAAEVVVTNPAVPFCGLVRVADDAHISWQCEIGGPALECALAVTDTIVPLLIHGAGYMRQS
jgi:hypothetical protein